MACEDNAAFSLTSAPQSSAIYKMRSDYLQINFYIALYLSFRTRLKSSSVADFHQNIDKNDEDLLKILLLMSKIESLYAKHMTICKKIR